MPSGIDVRVAFRGGGASTFFRGGSQNQPVSFLELHAILACFFPRPYCMVAELRYIYWFSQLEWWASVAQLAEQLICNQQVVGSSPSAGFGSCQASERRALQRATRTAFRLGSEVITGGFPSGQRGQTVNLMAKPS